jgi:hypothetical protein
MATTYPLPTKEERQIAKLELAQTKRQLVGATGYRELQYYDIELLPTKYSGNDIVDNLNIGGLVQGRPWKTMPHLLVALQYDQNHGYATNYGSNQICVLIADYPTIVNVPDGATVTITGTGSGTFTVSAPITLGGLRLLGVIGASSAWGSDILTFTWTA